MPEFTRQFRAMGTEVGLWLWHADEALAGRALAQAEQFFVRTEAQLSRFQADSELSRLNRAAGRPYPASPLLFGLVKLALAWRDRTGGIFDPTVLRALIAHGYDRSFEQVARRDSQAGSAPVSHPAGGRVRLNPAERRIWLPAGVGLDLGGIAKGWTVQQAAHRLGRLAMDLPAAVGQAGSGDGLVGQGQSSQVSLGLVRIGDAHQPVRSGGRDAYTGDVAPGIHQSRPQSAQAVGGLLHGPAFGDPTQVQADVRGQPNAALGRVQFDPASGGMADRRRTSLAVPAGNLLE